MSDLIAVSFPDRHQAEQVRLDLVRLQREHLVDIEDAVVAYRDEKGKVKLRQLYNLPVVGAVSGGFWGMLIGLLFLNPLFGLVAGSAWGAVVGALNDVGINDDFMKDLAKTMTPNSSALFVLVRHATADKVLEELDLQGGKVLRTSLSHSDEQKLRAALEQSQALQKV